MPQSLAKILVHTVFSTKDRCPFLRNTALRQELHHYLGGILKHLDCQKGMCGIDRREGSDDATLTIVPFGNVNLGCLISFHLVVSPVV
jgi:hypothetical protein